MHDSKKLRQAIQEVKDLHAHERHKCLTVVTFDGRNGHGHSHPVAVNIADEDTRWVLVEAQQCEAGSDAGNHIDEWKTALTRRDNQVQQRE